MRFEEKMIESQRIYEGRVINLRKDRVELQNGAMATREVIEHNGGVCVVAINENDEALMVSQFRYPYLEELLEVPAGKLEKGEDPYGCGMRELREETGASAQKLIPLGVVYPSPGYINEKLYLYLAEGLSYGEQSLDSDEFLEVIKVPFTEAIKMASDGRIKDAKTTVAILRAAILKGYIK